MNNIQINLQIPEGYVLVPVATYNKFLKGAEWQDIEIPTITDVSEYCGVSTDKIKKDLKKHDCPLRVLDKGKQGRNSQTTFIKQSVEHYKEWLRTK